MPRPDRTVPARPGTTASRSRSLRHAFLLAGLAAAAGGGEPLPATGLPPGVRSLTLGISVNCPYGLAG